MKTIKDAYEELNGDLNNTRSPMPKTDVALFFAADYRGYYCSNSTRPQRDSEYICTVEEFNNYKPAKTVLDAVIEFKGEWPADSSGELVTTSADWKGSPIWVGKIEIQTDIDTHGITRNIGDNSWRILCNEYKFNALVGVLASNFGKCDISYQKHCSNEVTRLEGVNYEND